MDKGIFHYARASIHRCIQNYFISAPFDISRSAVQLADSFSAIEALQNGSRHNNKLVSLNAKVTLKDLLSTEVADFTLVKAKGNALKPGELSYLSPLGIRLIGCTVGDQVAMCFMRCRIHIQILDITYSE